MTAAEWTDLLKAVADLIGVLIWPILVLVLVLRFTEPIGDFLNNMRELTLKAGGVEASAKRQEAVAALGAAIASRGDESVDAAGSAEDPSRAAAVLARALPNAKAYRRIDGARVLWVDDRPDNNRYERQSLEALGIDFSLSTSTADALAQLGHRHFDLVISDMGRPPDARAGYTLLDDLRRRGDETPFLIYAGSRSAEHVTEAQRHGAIGCTNSPSELIGLVTNVLTTDR